MFQRTHWNANTHSQIKVCIRFNGQHTVKMQPFATLEPLLSVFKAQTLVLVEISVFLL
jgi:hypothetical protein